MVITNVGSHVIITTMASRNERNSESCAGREARCGGVQQESSL